MVRRKKAQRARKIRDEATKVNCARGKGIFREEVWADASGNVTHYNLAFVNHLLCLKDNGRVLGYDNAHGLHHRHYCGKTEPLDFVNYPDVLDRFAAEVARLRKKKSL